MKRTTKNIERVYENHKEKHKNIFFTKILKLNAPTQNQNPTNKNFIFQKCCHKIVELKKKTSKCSRKMKISR